MSRPRKPPRSFLATLRRSAALSFPGFAEHVLDPGEGHGHRWESHRGRGQGHDMAYLLGRDAGLERAPDMGMRRALEAPADSHCELHQLTSPRVERPGLGARFSKALVGPGNSRLLPAELFVSPGEVDRIVRILAGSHSPRLRRARASFPGDVGARELPEGRELPLVEARGESRRDEAGR